MPSLERLPLADEPHDTIEELIRSHGAGRVLCALANVLHEHRKLMVAEGADHSSCQAMRSIERKCDLAGDTLQKEGL